LIAFSKQRVAVTSVKNHKRQRRNRQTRKVANAKVCNRFTNLTAPHLTCIMIGLYLLFGCYELWRLQRWRLRFLALSNAFQNSKKFINLIDF